MTNYFFCYACLEDKPASEQSLDPRYCQGCCDFLLNEAKMLTGGKRPAWIPRGLVAPQKPSREPIQSIAGRDMTNTNISIKVSNLSHPKTPVVTVKNEQRTGNTKDLPLDYIKHLATEGLGSRKIAARLGVEYGIDCSYRTIARVLRGERLT